VYLVLEDPLDLGSASAARHPPDMEYDGVGVGVRRVGLTQSRHSRGGRGSAGVLAAFQQNNSRAKKPFMSSYWAKYTLGRVSLTEY